MDSGKKNIDQKRPIYVAATSSGNGHAVACFGYKVNNQKKYVYFGILVHRVLLLYYTKRPEQRFHIIIVYGLGNIQLLEMDKSNEDKSIYIWYNNYSWIFTHSM